jgi:hypothetical protein
VFANTLLLSKELRFINIPDTQTAKLLITLVNFYENKISKLKFTNFIKSERITHSFEPTYHKNGLKVNKLETFKELLKSKK